MPLPKGSKRKITDLLNAVIKITEISSAPTVDKKPNMIRMVLKGEINSKSGNFKFAAF
jgi:hypothetical protein